MLIIQNTKIRVALLPIYLLVALVVDFNFNQPLSFASNPKDIPINNLLKSTMEIKGMENHSPILLRIFKQEYKLEVWKETNTGEFDILKTYRICNWGSGKLGPKTREGDGQAPEGYYSVTRNLMHPNSSYHLAINLGFPNEFDQTYNRTGSNLMVHGKCKSVGCYAMTDDNIEEIYALAREAFKGGQTTIQVHAFPFQMTRKNFVRYKESTHKTFWKNLKKGYDLFNKTKKPLTIEVSNKKYIFNSNIN